MHLSILDHGHRPIQKVLLWIFRMIHGGMPGPISVLTYRRDLFGKAYARAFHESMRGASEWTPGERELFAAFVAKKNQCSY